LSQIGGGGLGGPSAAALMASNGTASIAAIIKPVKKVLMS